MPGCRWAKVWPATKAGGDFSVVDAGDGGGGIALCQAGGLDRGGTLSAGVDGIEAPGLEAVHNIVIGHVQHGGIHAPGIHQGLDVLHYLHAGVAVEDGLSFRVKNISSSGADPGHEGLHQAGSVAALAQAQGKAQVHTVAVGGGGQQVVPGSGGSS